MAWDREGEREADKDWNRASKGERKEIEENLSYLARSFISHSLHAYQSVRPFKKGSLKTSPRGEVSFLLYWCLNESLGQRGERERERMVYRDLWSPYQRGARDLKPKGRARNIWSYSVRVCTWVMMMSKGSLRDALVLKCMSLTRIS